MEVISDHLFKVRKIYVKAKVKKYSPLLYAYLVCLKQYFINCINILRENTNMHLPLNNMKLFKNSLELKTQRE